MTRPDFLDPRVTERRNPRTNAIDTADARALVDLLNAEDRTVAGAVHAQREGIARGIEMVERAFAAGGRLLYVGAGTSGRLGVLDAAECPPTFGTDPPMVVGVIAGGAAALVTSREGVEDDVDRGSAEMDERRVGPADVVCGIAASGTTPYVRAALGRAQRLGAQTILLTCADPPAVLAESCDLVIAIQTGPEALTGSTRLKAGTATKLVLNTITTGAMIRSGRAWGNLMVDLRALSAKLADRGERILMEACGLDRARAREALAAAGGAVKTAIVMVKRGVAREEAERLLAAARGHVRIVVGDPPPVTA